MASAVDESEDFVTCGVCLCEYDDEIKKPKFLPCSHSLCLSCLKGIHSGGFIVCPLCRYVVAHSGEVSALPNNSFALHILQLKQKTAQKTVPVIKPAKNMWCLTCGSLSKLDCHSLSHSCIDMSAVSLKNFEALLTLRNDLKRKVEEGQTKLAESIEKRREVQNYLSQVAKALKMIAAEVDSLEEENNVLLTELVSLLEGHHHSAEQQQDEPCLSELMGLLDDCSSQDTIETLRQKLASKYQPQYEDKLALTTARAAELKKEKKTRITVSLFDESNALIPVCELFQQGFSANTSASVSMPIKMDLLLLSYITMATNKRLVQQKQPKPSTNLEAAASPLPASSAASAHSHLPRPSSSIYTQRAAASVIYPSLPVPTFRLFTLGIMKNNQCVARLSIEHQIPIQRTPYYDFLQELCKFSSVSPVQQAAKSQKSSAKVWKAVPNLLLEIPFTPERFQPVIPEFVNNPFAISDDINLPVQNVGDVGITQVQKNPTNQIVTGWSLIFPSTHFKDPKYSCHIKSIPPAFLFGRVSPTDMEWIHKLMTTKKNERPTYSFVLAQ